MIDNDNIKIKIANIYIGVYKSEEYSEEYDDILLDSEIVILEKLDYKFNINDKKCACVYKNLNNEEHMYLKDDNTIFNIDEEYCYMENMMSLRELLKKYNKILDIIIRNNKNVVNEYHIILDLVKNKQYITSSDFFTIFNYIYDLYCYYLSGVIDDTLEKLKKLENNIIDFNSKVRSREV